MDSVASQREEFDRELRENARKSEELDARLLERINRIAASIESLKERHDALAESCELLCDMTLENSAGLAVLRAASKDFLAALTSAALRTSKTAASDLLNC